MLPDPDDALLRVLTIVGLPAVIVTTLGVLLWARAWIDAGRATASGVAKMTETRSAPLLFLQLVLAQCSFVVLTTVFFEVTAWVMSGETEGSLAPTHNLGDALGAAIGWPLADVAAYAFWGALAYVAAANLFAAKWDGMASVGCLLGSAASVVVFVGIIGLVLYVQGTDVGAWVDQDWARAVILVGSGLAWLWLLVRSADYPVDLLHAVRQAKIRDPSPS